MTDLGYKQIQVLQLAVERGEAKPVGKIRHVCGGKSEAKRVLKTLTSRGLLKFEGEGVWVPTVQGMNRVKDYKEVLAQ